MLPTPRHLVGRVIYNPAIHLTDTTRGDISTSPLRRIRRPIRHARKADIAQRDVVARVGCRAARRLVSLAARRIAGDIHKSNVRDFHQRGP
jgi:hypothetical protein